MRPCPLCGDEEFSNYVYKSYVNCLTCQHTYQPSPPKSKVWMNPIGGDSNGFEGAVMGEQEKGINSYLASWIFSRYKPTRSVDVGCGYPYLAYCFKQLGVDATAMDGSFKGGVVENDLDVKTCAQDWEDYDGDREEFKGVDLITMIHSFEHFMDPIEAMKRAFDNLGDEGVLFLRSPNKDVVGIDRDHTEGHAKIHPNIFGTASMKYVAAKVGFHLIWYEHSNGYGQTSWVFRKRPAKLSLCMIVKNEESNILECLKTVVNYPDEIIVVDTGSTDNTIKLATSVGAEVYESTRFDKDTSVEDFNFSEARNESLSLATGDWVFWMDADDRFEGPEDIVLPTDCDGYHVKIHYGDTRFSHARFFRNNWGVHFKGAVHEFPVVHQCRMADFPNGHINHISAETNRIGRNTSILEKELELEPDNKRAMFYLGNSYREANRSDEAIKIYEKYVTLGGNFHDELLLAQYYISVCYYIKRDWKSAIREALKGIAIDDRWAELYCCIGEAYYFLKNYSRAICYLNMAVETDLPKTSMFIRKEMYDSTPKHYLSLCYEAIGEIGLAQKFASTKSRVEQLENRVFTIEVLRAGALGDVLCTTPALKELRKKYPKAHIRYVTHQSSKQILDCNPDVDEIVSERGKHADKIVSFDYPMHLGYPNTPMTKHLAHHFADCAGVTLPKDWKNVLDIDTDGKILLEYEKPIITFAVKTGWSKYKEWPLDRWEKLIEKLPKYQFVQIGAKGEEEISGAHHMMGKLSLRESFYIMTKSELFIGLDSVFQHAANALGVKAVVMFGSTSPAGSGYEGHVNLWGNCDESPCYRENNDISVHKKPPCPYDHKCMKEYMTVRRVLDAVKAKLKNTKRLAVAQRK